MVSYQLHRREFIHMLGYLSAEQWADAITAHNLNKRVLFELIKEIDDAYGCTIAGEVEELLEAD